MKKISADLIITNTGSPIPNGVVVYNEVTGVIIDIKNSRDGIDDIQYVHGILVPGYVNAHCHLELSHLKGVIPTGTGLIPFIQDVVGLRDFPQEEILEKINDGDREMFENGIVAVGDISNKTDTAVVKKKSTIRYYTFVEMFDFLQDNRALSTFQQYQNVYNTHSNGSRNKVSYVPHAPYSVSPTLFQYVNKKNKKWDTISIHNQELDAENQLFINKTGAFLDFYNSFDISLNDFVPIGKQSIYYTLEHLLPQFRTLFVHNTRTTKQDISQALSWNQQIFWVTCPNANLYIENSLPHYKDFIDCEAQMCIGTDSLSSNWQLSIFEEMKTIKKYQSGIDDYEIIKWATLNGANALGYQDLGALKVSCSPGINLIDVDLNGGKLDISQARSSVKVV